MNQISGFVDGYAVQELLNECAKMRDFDNHHVMTLKGVCLDGGPVPYVVLPYMANGSLLSYLRKERLNLIIKKDIDGENEDKSQIVRVCLVRNFCYYSARIIIHRYFSRGSGSWICVYRWLRAWSIWLVRRWFIETWQRETACMLHWSNFKNLASQDYAKNVCIHYAL